MFLTHRTLYDCPSVRGNADASVLATIRLWDDRADLGI